MPKVDDITRESWILGAFPEWGTWLNEEIDAEQVAPGTVAMWWLGCTGLWVKTRETQTSPLTSGLGMESGPRRRREMDPYHQMRNMTGGRMTQPNLRAAPIVYDPFGVTQVDAVCPPITTMITLTPSLRRRC